MTSTRKSRQFFLSTYSQQDIYSEPNIKGTTFDSCACSEDDHNRDEDSNNTPSSTNPVWAWTTSFRPPAWLLLPPTLLLLFSRVLFPCGSRVDLPSLVARPRESENYDAGAPFVPYEIQTQWGAYSPYYSVEEYVPPPQDCRLTQVNILQRHGARYPTLGQAANIAQALLKLQAAESYADERLTFINEYEYDLGIDDLLPFGEFQSSESGRKAYFRYSALPDEHNLPFVRASGSNRVVRSALKWIEGFTAGSGGTLHPPLALIIPEINGYNNTLQDKSCPNAEHPDALVKTWLNIYAQPIADWFNSIAQGLPENLTSEDVHSLVRLCALETVAKEEYSPFCALFNQDHFEGFEYAFDLEKFYFTGYGSKLGPVQGVGYINELLARLTDQPVRDYTQTNHTLDSSPETFPLWRAMYVDLSHDNLMVAVFSAMGLFNKNNESIMGGMLDPTKCNKSRDWVISRIVPFSGRMVVERMECDLLRTSESVRLSDLERSRRRLGEGQEDSLYVRVLVDDAVQHLDFCEDVDEDGLCPLRTFVESQAYARENGQGDWQRCFQ